MSTAPLLPIPEGCHGEARFGEALRIAEQIKTFMFATSQPNIERDFITGVAQYHAGARKTMPTKPTQMTRLRAKEIRQRGRNAAHHYLNSLDRQMGDGLSVEFAFDIDVDLNGVAGLMRPDVREAVRWHIIHTLQGTTVTVGGTTVTLSDVASRTIDR